MSDSFRERSALGDPTIGKQGQAHARKGFGLASVGHVSPEKNAVAKLRMHQILELIGVGLLPHSRRTPDLQDGKCPHWSCLDGLQDQVVALLAPDLAVQSDGFGSAWDRMRGHAQDGMGKDLGHRRSQREHLELVQPGVDDERSRSRGDGSLVGEISSLGEGESIEVAGVGGRCFVCHDDGPKALARGGGKEPGKQGT